MAVEASSETRCGIGARLRTGRELHGLTVLQAAEKLHIDPKMLEALESERFASLGATVYVRGHLRHYAELIGERFEELQALYDAKIHRPLPDLTHAPRAPRRSNPRKLLKPAVIGLVILVLGCAVWWVLTRKMH
jgi:cytoskeletal protein RodZ